VITAENLGKRYVITGGQREPYHTLRDSIARGLRTNVGKALRRSSSTPSDPPSPFWALRNVSFHVERGAVVGVVGRNGAGKSTLLKLLSRITAPTEGKIRIGGRVASLLEVGTGFHPELTGRENIFLNGAILGMGRNEIRSKFDEIVAFADVEKFLDMPVKRYSSGMYVRLAFAVAASLEPEILIVVEVLAVGDAEFQKKCLGKMRDVARDEGRTVFFVSHNMGAVRSLCTEAMWLDSGRVQKQGNPLSVINSYLETTTESTSEATGLGNIRRTWPGHAERLLIHRVTVNDGRAAMYGEPFRLAIHYELLDDAEDVSFEVGFGSIEGLRVMTLDSDLIDPRRGLRGRQWGWIVVEIDELRLQPGRYGVDIAVRSGDYAGLDYLPSCIWVNVLPGPNTPAVVFRESGGVRLPARWTWTFESEPQTERAVSRPYESAEE
jgi:lipopolysaccharide transport system ATP-binding protein